MHAMHHGGAYSNGQDTNKYQRQERALAWGEKVAFGDQDMDIDLIWIALLKNY